jgi:hypothetical protein
MALSDAAPRTGEIPVDRFGVRIAIIRAMRGWNYTEAGQACDIRAENWRLWEKTDRKPQDYEDVCRRIADGSGFDEMWLSVGGPLSRSRCFVSLPMREGEQMEMSFPDPRIPGPMAVAS